MSCPPGKVQLPKGDLHETVISHIRRGLENRFPRSTPGETRARFATRMSKVQDYLNSSEFKAQDGAGLASLARSLRERCHRVSLLNGERLRTCVPTSVYRLTSDTVQSLREFR